MEIKEKQVIKTFEVEMTQDELSNVYRLLKNEIEGSGCCDNVSADMYDKLKRLHEGNKTVNIIRMGAPGQTFFYKNVEITEEEYTKLKKLGCLYESIKSKGETEW